MNARFRRALGDFVAGGVHVRAWLSLAQDDIAGRYRRTKLGPFWLTLSHAAMIAGLSLNFSIIFKQPLGDYFLYVAAGMTVWSLISSTLSDAPYSFIRGKGLLLAFVLPASLHIFRTVATHFIIFAHHLVLYGLALIFIRNVTNWNTLLAVPGLALVALAAVGYSSVLAFLAMRYRDVGPAVSAVTMMLFMLTPIFWQKAALGDQQWIALFNPMFHLVEVIREPLLGRAPSALNWLVSCGVALVSLLIGASSFVVARDKLSYWL